MIKWPKAALPKTAVGWVHLFWMTAAGAVVVFLIQALVQAIWLNTDFKQWDFLAFAGSIMGGFITWWGVRATIKHSDDTLNREKLAKHLEGIPNKVRLLDRIDSEITKLMYILGEMQGIFTKYEEEMNLIPDHFHELNKAQAVEIMRGIVDSSIDVDSELYITLVRIEQHLNEVNERESVIIDGYKLGVFTLKEVIEFLRKGIEFLPTMTQRSQKVVRLKRRYYLSELFPDDDPESFGKI